MFFDSKAPQETPHGWYKVKTGNGNDAGLGFDCPKCHFAIVANAPPEIFHCGALEKQPVPGFLGGLLKPLPTFTLPYGARRMGRAIISVND